jgi:hypothetical protein
VGARPAVFDPAIVDQLAGSMRPLAVLPEMFVYEIHCRDDRRRLTGPRYEYSWNLVMIAKRGRRGCSKGPPRLPKRPASATARGRRGYSTSWPGRGSTGTAGIDPSRPAW